MEVFREEFDAMWEHGGLWIGVWHPFATGRLARWMQVEKLVDYMRERGDVWFAPMEAIAQHVLECRAEGTWQPKVDQLPYFDGPVAVRRP